MLNQITLSYRNNASNLHFHPVRPLVPMLYISYILSRIDAPSPSIYTYAFGVVHCCCDSRGAILKTTPDTKAYEAYISGTPNAPGAEPAPCCILWIRLMYCLLTTFQVAIYFSMHAVKQPSSLFDNDVPGEGMHFSKQCSFTFCGTRVRVG